MPPSPSLSRILKCPAKTLPSGRSPTAGKWGPVRSPSSGSGGSWSGPGSADMAGPPRGANERTTDDCTLRTGDRETVFSVQVSVLSLDRRPATAVTRRLVTAGGRASRGEDYPSRRLVAERPAPPPSPPFGDGGVSPIDAGWHAGEPFPAVW